ncbi:exodeoxyribonuclease VII large subunit [Legionella taurinensis]|uniref:Exodeoxyribonuclease 7 large subunit n=1 Tax=Legionella taurinensis TaxID=70611 RepID=A0AB38N721_9GAMM|nr:exodeoxyribonuclease VII large subunit [Legionella taurinensis]PUT45409.1 exodeoxyribonuclease VII large subunit [Legionella taurinensis]PUT47016.1 exodeoxyribonuclease VII large subunit [Legionella taurinensis]PUT49176.1 exodeoxyribonuclease VII large subunit [Legionella taurinensis]TID37655.1 exodeoxyribonuclease VII large subunit [Legionella taurinensis]
MSLILSTLTVSQLNRQIRSWLELDIGEVSVVGELSNLSKPASGHYYFTLKDAAAQLRCVFFRNHHTPDARQFRDGQQVIARGKLSLYEARGDYQLIVQELTDHGLGELYRQFELLKTRLQQQGLFDAARKKAIPAFPQTIAVVTSASGAALHDILATLARRYPIARVLVYCCEVQGKGAAAQLINAVKKANADGQSQVMILARGGGSIEDLWAFNDEKLAIAIHESAIPIVSGIGHETDFTIADFVADLRAATPTAAAESVTPNQQDLLKFIGLAATRMVMTLDRLIQHHQMQLSHRLAALSSPEQLIYRYWQSLDHLQQRLQLYGQRSLYALKNRLQVALLTLKGQNPHTGVRQALIARRQLEQRLLQVMAHRMAAMRQTLSLQMSTLNAVSPLATLERGYAIATHQGRVVFSSGDVSSGDELTLRLSQGSLICQVTQRIE